MSDGDNARCPRCGGNFHCGVKDPEPCACTSIALDALTLERLRGEYDACLCVGCLGDIAAGGTLPPSPLQQRERAVPAQNRLSTPGARRR
jgi:Cysteine-rich CWC